MINAIIFDELAKYTLLKKAIQYDLNLNHIQDIFIDELDKIESIDKNRLKLFIQKIKFTNSINDCWEWQAYLEKFGYGTFWIGKTMMKAHRLFFRLINSIILDKDCLHKCDNPSCCNPFHIFEGDDQDNINDMINKNRQVILRNEDHGMCYISNEIVRQICLEVDTTDNIAKKYNISISTVVDIRRKKIRKEITSDIEVVYPCDLINLEYENIINDYDSGNYTWAELQKKYNITKYKLQQFVSKREIKSRTGNKHVGR